MEPIDDWEGEEPEDDHIYSDQIEEEE